MELQITGKNMELSPEVRRYIESKLGKLSRHLPEIGESRVEIVEEKTKSPEQHFVVQITVNSNGTLLRGEERGSDLLTAINKVAAVIDRQIEHFKGKRARRRKGAARETRNQPEQKLPPPTQVVKVKRFVIQPMSVTEAIDRMELLDHAFFLFLNEDTEELNLIYRRRDNNYGLIESEIVNQ
jgi:putative sigma-54 modulation protein